MAILPVQEETAFFVCFIKGAEGHQLLISNGEELR